MMTAPPIREPIPEEPAAANAAEPAIFFPCGLVGCPAWKRFVLMVDDQEALPVAVLKSLDDAQLAFMITDPTLLVADYTVPLSHEDREALGLEPDEAPVLYCTVAVSAEGLITANLLGPLVINQRTGHAKQLVLHDSPYSTKYPVATVDQASATPCSS